MNKWCSLPNSGVEASYAKEKLKSLVYKKYIVVSFDSS